MLVELEFCCASDDADNTVLEAALVDAIVEVVFVLWLDMAGGLCNCEIVARCVCNIGSNCSWERWFEE
jgi:hypothetical protein